MIIYYDPTDGVLLAPDDNGRYNIVETNAQLDPSRLSLSEDGYLTLLDFEGNPHTMCDENGNPISLKGPKGDKGDKGDQGEHGQSAYSVNLSNDFDHVALQDGKVITDNDTSIDYFPITTTVSLFLGSDKISLTSEDIQITDAGNNPLSEDSYTTSELPDGSVQLTLTHIKEGQIFLGDSYNIIVTTKDGLLITKTLKVITTTNVVDYELDIYPSTINIGSDGKYQTSRIQPKVVYRQFGQTSTSYSIVSDLPSNLSISYSVDNNTPSQLLYGSSLIMDELKPTKYIDITLKNGATILDAIRLECIKSGKDGTSFNIKSSREDCKEPGDAYVDEDGNLQILDENGEFINAGPIQGPEGQSGLTISASNDMDQVPTREGKVYIEDGSDYVTTFSIYVSRGSEPVSGIETGDINTTDNITVEVSDINNNCITVNISIQNGADFTGADVILPIICNNAIVASKTFKLVAVNSTIDYDLYVHPSTIQVDGGYSIDSISPQIKSRIFGQNSTSYELLDSENCPDTLVLKYAIDGGTEQPMNLGSTLLLNDLCPQEKITISLYNGEQVIDIEEVEILQKSKVRILQYNPTTSVVYLNSQGGALEKDQNITKLFTLVQDGAELEFDLLTVVDSDGNPVGSSSENLWTITFAHEDLYDTGVYVYTASCIYEDRMYSTQFTIDVVQGSTVYDLKINPNIITCLADGSAKDPLEISVYEDCSGGGYSEETIVPLSASDSSVTIRITGIDADGDSLPAQYFENGKITIPVDQIPSDSFTITLYDSEGDIKDFQTISSVRDGKDGEIITEIANEFLVEGTGDKANEVVAGLTKDDVFFWGGGTQEESKAQQTPLYFKTDGTGKIGVFKINEDNNVEISTNQGKIVIDNIEGITLFKDEKAVTKIVSGSIEDYLPYVGTLKETNRTLTGTDPSAFIPPTIGQVQSLNIDGVQRNVLISGIIPKLANADIEVTMTLPLAGIADVACSWTFADLPNHVSKTIECLIAVSESKTTCSTSTKYEKYADISGWPNDPIPILSEPTENITIDTFTGENEEEFKSGIVMSYTVTYEVEYTLQYREVDTVDPITIIGDDGIACVNTMNSFFYIKQGSTSQKVVFRGLPNESQSEDLPEGGLYTAADGTLKVKNTNNSEI